MTPSWSNESRWLTMFTDIYGKRIYEQRPHPSKLIYGVPPKHNYWFVRSTGPRICGTPGLCQIIGTGSIFIICKDTRIAISILLHNFILNKHKFHTFVIRI